MDAATHTGGHKWTQIQRRNQGVGGSVAVRCRYARLTLTLLGHLAQPGECQTGRKHALSVGNRDVHCAESIELGTGGVEVWYSVR